MWVTTGDMLELARSVLYIPPTETEAETAFSIQKWLLSGDYDARELQRPNGW